MSGSPSSRLFVLDEPARLLLVDDDAIFREFASVHLNSPASSLITAADGEDAWNQLVAERFDLALVDIDMPRLDGFGLVARIRADERLRHLPVIMVTGREDVVSIDRAYEAGATSFVAKPVNWRQLSYQIRYVLRMSRVEADLRASRDRAEEHSRLKSGMLAVMRHEFRTPLNAIIGFARMIAEGVHGVSDARYGDYAGQIAGAGAQLLRMHVEMMNYAQLLAGGFALQEDEYRLDKLLDAVVRDIAASHSGSAPDITLSIPTDALTVTGDREQLLRMLRHLIENAVRHGGGKIRVDARIAQTGDLCVEIADAGPGIPEARIAACLEPFTHGEMALTRAHGGLGLGLPISRRIAELHGGRLAIGPGRGGGTLVQVMLPAARVGRPAITAA